MKTTFRLYLVLVSREILVSVFVSKNNTKSPPNHRLHHTILANLPMMPPMRQIRLEIVSIRQVQRNMTCSGVQLGRCTVAGPRTWTTLPASLCHVYTSATSCAGVNAALRLVDDCLCALSVC